MLGKKGDFGILEGLGPFGHPKSAYELATRWCCIGM